MTAGPSALAGPLQGAQDLDRLVERAGRARVVLLGEASHGTHECYRWRALLTQRLIAFVYFDRTRALHPLGPQAPAPEGELETYPAGV